MYDVNTIKEMLQKYGNGTGMIAIFFCCIVWTFVKSKNSSRKYLIIYGIGSMIVLNPFSIKILRILGALGTEYRFIWLVPIVPVMTYVSMEILTGEKNIKNRFFILVIMIGLLYFTGDTYLKSSKLKLPETVYGIPKDTIEISNIIDEVKQKERVVLVMDRSLELTIRQWNASIICGISRESYIYGIVSDEVFETLYEDEKEAQILMRLVNNGEAWDIDATKQCLQDQSVDFVVMNKKFEMENYMQELGCELVGENQTYEVYATET